MGGNKISASEVCLKWVKSNRHRKKKRETREEREKKVSDYNGQYLSPEPTVIGKGGEE